MASDDPYEKILSFWFAPPAEGEDRPTGKDLWFGQSMRVDRLVEKRFGRLLEDARAGRLDGWASTARGRLALILLLDQVSRHVHRESPHAYASDERALSLCLDGLDDGLDQQLTAIERCFFYMPAMHSEDADTQLTSVEIFQELVDQVGAEEASLCGEFLEYAKRHQDVVERFDRFPHRNSILGRRSTAEESAYLQQIAQL